MLVIHRRLGIRTEIPGSGQWEMLSGQRNLHEHCWMCDLHKYTLIFWTREIGLEDESNISNQVVWKDAINELSHRENTHPPLPIAMVN
jgi:hypothetical protein